MTLDAEETILFLASRLNPGVEEIDRITQLVSSNELQIHYPKLIQMAIDHGVAPLLYKNINKVNRIPDNVIKKLKDVYLEATSFNLKKSHEILRILSALKDNNIDAIPLKGVIASELIFKNPALYYGTDIDILVKPSDLERSKKLLIELGYNYNERNEVDMLIAHYHLVLYKEHHSLELHWNLLKRNFNVSPGFWWEDSFTQKYINHDIHCLAPEKYLIYLIFRLQSHMFHPLKFFVLASEICNMYYNKINWTRFLNITKKIRMKKLAIFCLKFIHEYLGTNIPDNVAKKNFFGYNVFVKSIINILFKNIKRPYLRKIMYTLLLDSPYYIFISILKRIFPGRSELRLRYGIPEGSKMIYIFYIFNPILLPLLLLKKKRIEPTNNFF